MFLILLDLIIIGGSASGTAAGIYAARRNLNFKIITKEFGGEVAKAGEVLNYPGFSPNISGHKTHTTGFELAKAFKKHLEYYNIEIEENIEVIQISQEISGAGFGIIAQKNSEKLQYEAKTVIVATGTIPRKLNIPGEKEFYQKGVSYCTVCDGPLFKGKRVAVIGGGNSANEAGIMLAAVAEKVYILTINPEMQGETTLIEKLKVAKNVEIIANASVARIIGEDYVKSLEYEERTAKAGKFIEVDGIFIHIGMIPNSQFIGKEVNKNKFGEIIVNQKCETNIPGLFAAGDVTDVPYKQIAIASGQGVIAALSAAEYLNKFRSS